jgi:predicted GIY-YIG superfamily endonuclease
MPWLYILKCSDDSYYTGSTPDLERRLSEHQNGIACAYTSTRRPVKLIYCQEFQTLLDAFQMERRIKGWGRKKKEALIKGDWEELKKLSRSRSKTAILSPSNDGLQ